MDKDLIQLPWFENSPPGQQRGATLAGNLRIYLARRHPDFVWIDRDQHGNVTKVPQTEAEIRDRDAVIAWLENRWRETAPESYARWVAAGRPDDCDRYMSGLDLQTDQR